MTESSENRFRERRSAFRESDAETVEPVAGAAEEAVIAEPEEPVAPEAPASEPIPEPRGTTPVLAEEPPLEEELDVDEMSRIELPDPTFNEIVYEYAIRAQQFLGETPLTREGRRHVLPNYAKHMIDLLGILEERTRGNLTPEESQLIEQVLSDLRMRYVSLTT
jgi:hypothetical protein